MCFEVESSQVQVDTSVGLDAGLSAMIAYFFGSIEIFNFFVRLFLNNQNTFLYKVGFRGYYSFL